MPARVFIVPVLERWLLCAPLHRTWALVNAAAVGALKAGRVADGPGPLAELAASLAGDPPTIPSPRDGRLDPQFLGLIPTRACNLRCRYCDFGAADAPQDRMSYEMAVAAVDWMAGEASRSGRRTLDVHFFGGEPFVAGDVVDVAVHRARAVAAQRELVPRFECATNGVFDERTAQFVGDYFDTVVLSFDGPRDIQDRQRPAKGGRGSFEAVARTAKQLGESPTELCFRVCVTQETVARLEETTAWFCEAFAPSIINFETLKPTAESAAAGLERPDPYAFAAHCVRASRVAATHGVEPVYAAAAVDEPRSSFCPVGNDTLIVSADGRVSSCYLPRQEWERRGLDLDVGHLDGGGRMHVDSDAIARLRRLVTEKPRCERCFCQWTCAGGCHVASTYPGCPEAYDAFCIQCRLITACSVLASLGAEAMADELLGSRAAMEALARQPFDRIEDWEQNGG